MAKMRCELVLAEGVKNIRDAGGYPMSNGEKLNRGKFFRAGSLSNATVSGIKTIKALGVDCVVDLRSSFELEQMPNPFASDPDVAFVHLPMLDYIQSNIAEGISTFPRSLTEMYRGLLDNDQHQFKQVFSAFAQKEHHVILYHCTAGKDRTGVTTMLLQQLCGMDDDSIIEDYSWSKALIGDVNISGNFPINMVDSDPQTMRDTLTHLREVYGNAQGYLEKSGVSPTELNAILAKMCE